MTGIPEKNLGRVCLVGAGPGDPGLITWAGLDRLRRAEVVVFDALASPQLLNEVSDAVEKIDVGKRADRHTLSQDQINQLLVVKAAEGKFVVRLKGGDPLVFGRGAEEAAHLARHGIPCEIIPGITAGYAAPAAAGIPVTHRRFASTVTFVTGHEDPDKAEPAVDYRALTKLIGCGGTACFYMGLGRLTAIRDSLTEAGLAGDTPVAVVQWGTLPQQRSVRGRISDIRSAVDEAGITAPAIIVVGPVAGMDPQGLDYFTLRPLFGKTVVVTRTRHQASVLSGRLTLLGARVLEAPTIELRPLADSGPVDRAIRELPRFDWLVLTSANGVTALASRLEVLGLDARQFAGVRVAAIGDATADALADHLRIRADVVPADFVAEALAAELIATRQIAGRRLLLLRADIARADLVTILTNAGAEVTELAVYETRPAPAIGQPVLRAFRERRVDWVTFTSSSTATNLAGLLGDERDLLRHTRIASIGPITTRTVQGLGLDVAVEASPFTIAGLVAAVVGARQGEG